MAIPHYITYGISYGVFGSVIVYLFYAYIWKSTSIGRMFWYLFSRKSIAQVKDFLIQNPNFQNLSSEEKILLLSKSNIAKYSPLFISEIIKKELKGGNKDGRKEGLFHRSKEGRTTDTEPAPAEQSSGNAGDYKQIEPCRDSQSGEDCSAPRDTEGTKEKSRYFD